MSKSVQLMFSNSKRSEKYIKYLIVTSSVNHKILIDMQQQQKKVEGEKSRLLNV